jgi:septum formation protein
VRLYLASTSPARLATLRAAGIEPVLLASGVDEEAAVASAGPLTAAEMVLLLARLKAEAVVGRIVDGEPIDGFILGGDSAFELDGAIYGKPHTPSVARERWLAQRGREGILHSGHWLIDHRQPRPGQTPVAEPVEEPATQTPLAGAVEGRGAVSSAHVRFAASVTDAEIDAYIATGEPLEVAGAFTIDSLGGAFISELRGDPHAVVGLSLATVRELLLGFGVAWPSLWNRSL